MWLRHSVISAARRLSLRALVSRLREGLMIPLSSVAVAAQTQPGNDQPGLGYAWWWWWWWVVIGILIVLALWWVFSAWWPSRRGGRRSDFTTADIPAEETVTEVDRALEILRERYAAGEITETEYQEMRRELEERR